MNGGVRLSGLGPCTRRRAWLVMALVAAFARPAHAEPESTSAPAMSAPPPSDTSGGLDAAAGPPSTGSLPATPEAPRASRGEAARVPVLPGELAKPEGVAGGSGNAAMPKLERSVVEVDDKGFMLASADRSFLLKLRGLLQVDGRFFTGNDALAAADTFLVRKLRISLDGTLFSFVDIKMVPELAGTAQVLDGYADLHPWPWLRLRVGKYKPPIGMERLQCDADRSFLELSLVQNLSAQRDIGLSVWGEVGGGVFHYTIGLFNGAPDNSGSDVDSSHAKDIQGRVLLRPFRGAAEKTLGNLGMGFSAGTGNRKGRLPTATAAAATGLPVFRTSGQNAFFQYHAPSTDTTGIATTFTHGRSTRLNPQLYYFRGPFGLAGEYLWLSQGVQRGGSTTQLRHQAASATFSFVVKGTQSYEGPTPGSGFDLAKGTVGAFEVAARWSGIWLDGATFGDPNVPDSVPYANPAASAKSAQSYGGVVSWIPRRTFRISASFERTHFKGGAGTTATPTDRPAENVIIARTQANF